MMATSLALALALLASPSTPPSSGGEALPPGAPTQPYELTAWCYGAMSEYLDIYERVKPDLRAIDKQYGSSVQNEKNPYSADMAAAHAELNVLAGAVVAAEKASPNPIAPQGAAAIKLGRSIWSPAEGKTSRELARAWLSWGMPDRCDSTARTLAANSALLGKALSYNNPSATDTPPPAAEAPPPPSAPMAEPGAPDNNGPAPDPNGPVPDPVQPNP
jgi:hypothetical protein